MGRWQNGEGTLVVTAEDTEDTKNTEDGTAGPGGPDGAGGPGRSGGVTAEVPLEIAASYRARTRGLLGRDGVRGAILLTPANNVHTFRMRFSIDVAYLDRHLRVLAVHTMPPNRLGMLRLRARHVLEAEAGAMAGWGLRRGARVAVRTGPTASR